MKIFISTTTFAMYQDEPLQQLKKQGFSVELNSHKKTLREDQIANILNREPYVGLIAGTEPLTQKVLEKAGSLRVISRAGAGLENIDLKAAKKLGIKIYKTSGVLTDSVAELTIGLMLACLRHIPQADRQIRENIWQKQMGWMLKNQIVGIIGLGCIGRAVAKRIKSFGCQIIYYDPHVERCRWAKKVSYDYLLRKSNLITVHASEQRELIGAQEIQKMQENVILINTARGGLINESDVLQAIHRGKVRYAAFDVFQTEPYQGKLQKCDRVVLTPHIGSYALEARIEMERKAVRNLIIGLKMRG